MSGILKHASIIVFVNGADSNIGYKLVGCNARAVVLFIKIIFRMSLK